MARNEDFENEEEEFEEEDTTDIAEQKAMILRSMKECVNNGDRQGYAFWNEQLAMITESERNETQTRVTDKSWIQGAAQIVIPTLGQVVGTVVGQMLNRRTVGDVCRFEDNGHIVSGKAASFITKPR